MLSCLLKKLWSVVIHKRDFLIMVSSTGTIRIYVRMYFNARNGEDLKVGALRQRPSSCHDCSRQWNLSNTYNLSNYAALWTQKPWPKCLKRLSTVHVLKNLEKSTSISKVAHDHIVEFLVFFVNYWGSYVTISSQLNDW